MKSRLRALFKPKNGHAPELTFADYVAERAGMWSEFSPTLGALVLLGDSHIERGHWSEWWPCRRVLNRGIGGQTIAEVHARIAEVVRHSPRLVVIECGHNDIAASLSSEDATGRYRALLNDLKSHLPTCQFWIQSVPFGHFSQWRHLPLTQARAHELGLNAKIRDLNEHLERLAREQSVPFFDSSPFLNHEGALNGNYTLDGIHLNGVGYRVWREAIERHAPPAVAALLNSAE